MNRLVAVSVDLDAIRFYRAIHGLGAQESNASSEQDPVLGVAVRRLADWAAELDIPLTWFVVGRDLDDERYKDTLDGLCRRGHELGNHSLDHFYDLTRRGRGVIREQVLLATERLSRITGRSQHGFRAPGYTMTDELHSVLRELGVAYDSSVFPCPAYFCAKAVALFGQRLFGRESHAILDEPRVLSAPMRPYRMGENYLRSGEGILELPIQVTPRLRLPYLGTSLTALGPSGAKLLTRGVIGESLINLELHGIDALDAGDGLADLALVQPDLRIGWQRKLETLGGVVRQLKDAAYRCSRLDEVAAEYS